MMKHIVFAFLLIVSTSFAEESWHDVMQPSVDFEGLSAHLDDQNVHFYYFSQCAHDGDGDGDVEPFYYLVLEHSDICNIHDLLAKMSSKGVFSLLKNAKSLYSLGDKIRRVHPLRFSGYIFSQHDLRKKMKTISESSFKWNNFINGFGDRMDKEIRQGNFYHHLPGFYDSLKHLPMDRSAVEQLIESRNWNGLARYFINL